MWHINTNVRGDRLMSDYTTLTIRPDTLERFHNVKEALYGELADEISNERMLNDLLDDAIDGDDDE